MVSLQSSDFWKLANCFHSVPFNPTFLAHFLRSIFKCSEVVSIQLLSVSETCNDFLWYLWFSSFSVSVGLKVFRSLHWFTEASLLIILEMLFLFSSFLLRKLPPTSCDSYGSLIPHDLEILVVDDLILSKPDVQNLSWFSEASAPQFQLAQQSLSVLTSTISKILHRQGSLIW